MMRKILTIMSVCALLLAVSCRRQEGTGCLAFGISADMGVRDQVKSQVSDYTSLPAAGDFILAVEDASGTLVWSGKLSEWNVDTPLAVGSYKVTASYGAEGEEGVDKPWFSGTVPFSIYGGETAGVTIPVSLQNCIVRLNCTDAFRNYFPEYSFTVKTGSGAVAVFDNAGGAPMFMDAYKFTVSGTLVNQGGRISTFGPKEYGDLDAATCYTLGFDASNVGSVRITVSFNDTVETVDLGDIELN